MAISIRTALSAALLILLTASCQKETYGLPDRDSVAKTNALPIDGHWDVRSDTLFGSTGRIKLDCGRAIVIDDPEVTTGYVIIKNLERLDESRYRGIRFVCVNRSEECSETPTTLEVVSTTELIEHIQESEVLPKWRIRDFHWRRASIANEASFLAAHSDVPAIPLKPPSEGTSLASIAATVTDIGTIYNGVRFLMDLVGLWLAADGALWLFAV